MQKDSATATQGTVTLTASKTTSIKQGEPVIFKAVATLGKDSVKWVVTPTATAQVNASGVVASILFKQKGQYVITVIVGVNTASITTNVTNSIYNQADSSYHCPADTLHHNPADTSHHNPADTSHHNPADTFHHSRGTISNPSDNSHHYGSIISNPTNSSHENGRTATLASVMVTIKASQMSAAISLINLADYRLSGAFKRNQHSFFKNLFTKVKVTASNGYTFNYTGLA